MSLAFFLLSFHILNFAGASDDRSQETRVHAKVLQSIIQAKSVREIKWFNKVQSDWISLDSKCQLELKLNHLLPLSCVKRAELEYKIGLISKKQRSLAFERLSHICEHRIADIMRTDVLELAVSVLNKSWECYKKASLRLKSRQYQDIEHSPDDYIQAVYTRKP